MAEMPEHGLPISKRGPANSEPGAHTSADGAPILAIPERSLVSVEHPCIVRNIENAIRTLGGPKKIRQILDPDKKDQSLDLFLRPDDSMSTPITSQGVGTSDVLLRVTVPKRTGRKRKRGSTGPFVDEEMNQGTIPGEDVPTTKPKGTTNSTQNLLQALQDNPSEYTVEPIGTIQRTHRFRGLSDFQYSTTNNSFVQKVKNTIGSDDYPTIKRFKFDPSRGVKPMTELVPPPGITGNPIPFNYAYLQNPAVQLTLDTNTGNQVLKNISSSQKILTIMVRYNIPTVPTTYSPQLPPLESVDPKIRQTVARMQTLMEARPIWTRRALANHLVDCNNTIVKLSVQYVGYMFRSGPWREAVVKLGVDPRTDPKYRIYQTMMFQITTLEAKSKEAWIEERAKYQRSMRGKPRNATSHIFDGRNVSLDGKVWQVCDITDALLKGILDTDNLRDTCDIHSDGYYHNLTWSKVKTLMKMKLEALVTANAHLHPSPPSSSLSNPNPPIHPFLSTSLPPTPTPADIDLSKFLALPDELTPSNRKDALLPRGTATERELRVAHQMRLKVTKTRMGEAPGVEGAGKGKEKEKEKEKEGEAIFGGSRTRRRRKGWRVRGLVKEMAEGMGVGAGAGRVGDGEDGGEEGAAGEGNEGEGEGEGVRGEAYLTAEEDIIDDEDEDEDYDDDL